MDGHRRRAMDLSPSSIAIQAAIDGNLHILKKMAGKVDLREVSDPNGRNVLHFAAGNGHLDVCAFLVEESGFDVNCTTAHGKTPVAHAAVAGKVDVLRYLLDRGGDPAMPDPMGTTPLHDAADFGGHLEAARLLLSRGVDVDPIDYRGTPLHLAAGKGGNDQVVKLLLEHGANPNRVYNYVFTPLMFAFCERSLECMKLLVEGGADVNFRNPCVPTVLMKAAAAGSTDIVKFLLEAGADPNILDELGKNAIVYAAEGGLRGIVEILFLCTKPIASLPDWSIDGIINAKKHVKDAGLMEEIPADVKQRGNEAFAKGDYHAAVYFYNLAMSGDPVDATVFANRSLCWLRLRDGKLALLDAQLCTNIRPRWSKAWYHQGAALSLLKNYNGAVHAFAEALQLDPASDEIRKSLREATEAASTTSSEEQKP